MLLTVNLLNKDEFVFKTFKRMWSEYVIECQICFDRIICDGVIGVTNNKKLNLEKMFHAACIKRWLSMHNRDPFNRDVRYWFDFPPKSFNQCSDLMALIDGFIGEHQADKAFGEEFRRLTFEESFIDIELDFEDLLKYKQ
ncbi:hypothetical protein [Rachiplusia nu nucleopolyhedrovirus]|uniref:Ac53 n=1 Tax=Rachiplusia nu nucleopolyhedrovirus TaxID=2605775 RepID=A0AAE6M5N2_9ABAC|nr:hypothetical protein QKQ55_gp042 [Rachiplusia nu nucleopolyhedrovirus]QEI03594.1 hypothetical protein [Rachiplusia nu nucleopolyhedrovirus]